METQLPLPKKGAEIPPQFLAYVYCGQTAAWIKMPLGMEVGLGPRHIVLDRTQLPSPKKGHSPQFSAHVCDQAAGWIKMPLGTMVGLGPGRIVLDADPAPHPIGHSPTNFGPCLLWPNSWMDQDATWYEGRPWPRPHCVTWGPSSLLPKGVIFGPCLLRPSGCPSQLLLSTCTAMALSR